MGKALDKKYWDQRYETNGNSGSGSRGELAQFKVGFVNDVVKKFGIVSCVDFGSGDGEIASKFEVPKLHVTDVSSSARRHLRSIGLKAVHPLNLKWRRYDLVVSLDVIFHITSKKDFELYMKRMTRCSKQLIVIYGTEALPLTKIPQHMANNDFSSFMDAQSGWSLICKEQNKYPYNPQKPHTTSPSNFYVWERN